MFRDFAAIVSNQLKLGRFADAEETCRFFGAICGQWEKQKNQRKESAEKGLNKTKK